jgi:hypothetical protein
VTEAPVPQQKASHASPKSPRVKRLSITVHPHSFSASSMTDARVTPGRIVCESKHGVTMVLFGKTAKKLEAPASSTASPLHTCVEVEKQPYEMNNHTLVANDRASGGMIG